VFVNTLGAGVIYLRLTPSTQYVVYNEMKKVLQIYSEEELKKAFVVVEPSGHRIRRLSEK
jgi:hypothetical protein